jgi:iron complex transport system ATP-binding protein
MIRIENVSFAHGRTAVLHDVSLDIPKGGITALIGPNGAGKSTLLSLIARLQKPARGTITVDGLSVQATPTAELAKLIAIMRQDPGVASRLRVRELVGFGRFPHHRGRPTPADLALVEEALALFDLAPLADRFVDTLSGGQRQRALVAMAFAQGTDYLLLDEPLNNLDVFYARELMRTLGRVARERSRTILIVLHDINHAAIHADRIVAMKDGRVVAHGPAREIVTPHALEDVFGYRMPVETVDGRPVALHFF